MPRAQRQKLEVERTRGLILDAAARAFARAGYRATTMRDIAREAGYSTPTLYAYFKGKQDIYEGLTELVVGELMAVFDRALPEGIRFEASLEIFVERMFTVVDRRGDAFAFFLTLTSGGEGGPPRRKKQHEDESRIIDARLVTWLRDNIGDDDLAAVDPHVLQTALHGLITGFLQRWVQQGRTAPATTLVPVVVTMFIGGARAARERQLL